MNEMDMERIIKQVKRYQDKNLSDQIVEAIYKTAENITSRHVKISVEKADTDRRIDDILTSKWLGIPIMLLMLAGVFWITLQGANYPSQLLADVFFWGQEKLTLLFVMLQLPDWLHGILVLGIYRSLAWVVSVMLPPMAIFFPLFTIMEDLGYLPRVAFNLDRFFKKAGAHGKQALTMCMGFGCNAAGVIACRIIDSPRERLIATLTNNFVPCNGRFPTLFTLSSLFIGGLVSTGGNSFLASGMILAVVMIGIFVTLAVSRALSATILKGVPSSFTLELPPYRKPKIGRILIKSLLDRTVFVLARAVTVAAPAGAITWMLANIVIDGKSLIAHGAAFLNPLGQVIGLDGFILMAFILGLPANEIVLPILVMSYLSEGAMLEIDGLHALKELFYANGWTRITPVCMMLFSLLHFPCATTLWTISKETKSVKWTVLSAVIPTSIAFAVCFIVKQCATLLDII